MPFLFVPKSLYYHSLRHNSNCHKITLRLLFARPASLILKAWTSRYFADSCFDKLSHQFGSFPLEVFHYPCIVSSLFCFDSYSSHRSLRSKMRILRTSHRSWVHPIFWSVDSVESDSPRNFHYMCWYYQIYPMEEFYYPERLSCLASLFVHYFDSDLRSSMSLQTYHPISFPLNDEMAPFLPLES